MHMTRYPRKRVRAFAYRLGEITDANGNPVSDRAFVEIVDADDPQVLLGEINVEIEGAEAHARKIVAALSAAER